MQVLKINEDLNKIVKQFYIIKDSISCDIYIYAATNCNIVQLVVNKFRETRDDYKKKVEVSVLNCLNYFIIHILENGNVNLRNIFK